MFKLITYVNCEHLSSKPKMQNGGCRLWMDKLVKCSVYVPKREKCKRIILSEYSISLITAAKLYFF